MYRYSDLAGSWYSVWSATRSCELHTIKFCCMFCSPSQSPLLCFFYSCRDVHATNTRQGGALSLRGCQRPFPRARGCRTPHPVSACLWWGLALATCRDWDETCPKSPRQLKPQATWFDFGQLSFQSGLPKREESKGGAKGSVLGGRGPSSLAVTPEGLLHHEKDHGQK